MMMICFVSIFESPSHSSQSARFDPAITVLKINMVKTIKSRNNLLFKVEGVPLSQQPNLLPSPERCGQEAFKIHLAKEIGPLSSLSSNLKTTEDIDCFIKSLLD